MFDQSHVAFKSEVYTKQQVDELIKNVDLSNYPTLNEMNLAISSKKETDPTVPR